MLDLKIRELKSLIKFLFIILFFKKKKKSNFNCFLLKNFKKYVIIEMMFF